LLVLQIIQKGQAINWMRIISEKNERGLNDKGIKAGVTLNKISGY